MKLRYIYKISLFAGLLLLATLGGCRSEELFPEPGKTETRVKIQFATAPNEVVTRATEVGTDTENTITKVDLFCFDKATGALLDTDLNTSVSKVSETVFEVVSHSHSGIEMTFVAMINMPAGTTYPATPTIDGLKQMALNGTLPASPFVMYGQADATINASTDIVRIPVSRSCAGIHLVNTDTNFTLEDGFWAFNLEQNGYVAADPATVTGYTSSLTDAVLTENGARAYTYPRNITVNAATPSTYLIFKGTLSNGQSSFYRVEVNVQAGKQVLESNHLYRVMITKVTDVGYATLEEAKAATADKKIVYTVSDWDDKNQSEIAFFGNYYLGVKQRVFDFDYVQQSATTEIMTNVPDVSIVPPVNSVQETSGGYTPASWSEVSIAQGATSKLLSVAVFENLEGKQRDAFCYVRATGIHTDDLKIRVDIHQLHTARFVSQAPIINISPLSFYGSSQESATYASTVTPLLQRQEWRIHNVLYEDEGEKFIAKVSTTNGSVAFAPDGTPTITGSLRFTGTGNVVIETRPVPTSKPRLAVVRIVTGEGNLQSWQDIFVYQDFRLDYTITYPTTVSNQMKRAKYVIETPLEQIAALSYTVSVTSNTSWRTVIEPAEASAWVGIANGTHTASGTGITPTTNPFTVTVQKNNSTPVLDGYAPARQAVIKIVAFDNETQTEYRSMDIKVYQGGYVTIGNDIWMDRNLKTGYRYSSSYSTSYASYPMIYPYAIPVGLSTDVYGAYAKDNAMLPRVTGYYGDEGYFQSGAPQSGYSGGYYRGTARYTYPVLNLKQYEWSEAYPANNPCPPGWRVPKVANWNPIITKVNQGQDYGKPRDILLDPAISAQNGEMVVKNAGRYISVPRNPGTIGGPIDWYLPAAGYRMINSIDMLFPGVIGQYQTADRLINEEYNKNFYFTNNGAFLYEENLAASTSVRCIRVQ